MPAMKEYTAEFKEQAVRFVLEEIEPDESRKHACDRRAPKLSVKAVTLYNWVKQYAPGKARPAAPPGSVEELRASASDPSARSPSCKSQDAAESPQTPPRPCSTSPSPKPRAPASSPSGPVANRNHSHQTSTTSPARPSRTPSSPRSERTARSASTTPHRHTSSSTPTATSPSDLGLP